MTEITNVKFGMIVKSGNAVMVDDHRNEIANMLEETARKIRERYTGSKLMDTNSNCVGAWGLDLEPGY